jgi:hypothetical protein
MRSYILMSIGNAYDEIRNMVEERDSFLIVMMWKSF